MKSTLIIATVCSLFLISCTGSEQPPANPDGSEMQTEESWNPSGTKAAAVAIMRMLENLPEMREAARPSAMMGIYTSLFLGQGEFVPVRAAMEAIGFHMNFQQPSTPDLDETFALLQDFGSVLQVDIVEEMNQSADRASTLDQYLQGLHTIIIRAEEKMKELDSQHDDLEDRRREERSIARDIEREVNTAFREGDYGLAGAKQRELTAAETRLATVEAEEKQISDVIDLYKDLMDVAQEQLVAMEQNREVLIAGLKVIEVPGIEDLGILQQKGFFGN